MHKGFFAEVLSARPLLWQAMLRFNAGSGASVPAADITRAMGEFAGPLLTWLDPNSEPSHGNAIPGVDGKEPFWDFAEESRRLALLDGQSVRNLACIAGVALHAPEAAHTVLRDERIALRQSLGEDLYRYALYRGQYQLGNVRRFFRGMDADLPLAARCARHGGTALRLVAGLWPGALVQRFLPLLPPSAGERPLPDLEENEIREIWSALKKLLLKEVVPAWAPCFD